MHFVRVLTTWAGLILAAPVFAQYPYQGCFETAAQIHKVPLELILAVAATESNWDPDARSHANAHGVMQIQWPGTAQHLGVKRVAELYNPCLNISLGAQYLAELLQAFADESLALAAYNYGPTRIRNTKELPPGARRYIARVHNHRNLILEGITPPKLQPGQQRTLVTFSSRVRATSLAKHLKVLLQGAVVSVQPDSHHHKVVIAIGQSGLTLADRQVIKNLGLTL